MNDTVTVDILAQTILDDAIAELAGEFVCVEWKPREALQNALAPNGEPYVCIATGGQRPEGAPLPALFLTPEAAVADWLLHVREYARRRGALPGATLYWRIRPEVDASLILWQEWRDGPAPERPGWYEKAVYRIYSRLLIVAEGDLA